MAAKHCLVVIMIRIVTGKVFNLKGNNIMKLAVVNGAILKCDKGAMPSPLSVTTPAATEIEYAPVATIMDHLPVANIKPFGVCAVTGGVCVPVTPISWFPGVPNIPLVPSIFPILSDVSLVPCAVGGIIEILSAGQTTVTIDSPAESSDNQAQNKKRRSVNSDANSGETDDDDANPSLLERLKKLEGKTIGVIPIPDLGQDIIPQDGHNEIPPPSLKHWTPELEEASEETEKNYRRMLPPNHGYVKYKEAEDKEYEENVAGALDALKKLLALAIESKSNKLEIETKEEIRRVTEEQDRRANQGRRAVRGRPLPKPGK